MIQQKNGTPKIRWLKQVLKPHAPHRLRAEKITHVWVSIQILMPKSRICRRSNQLHSHLIRIFEMVQICITRHFQWLNMVTPCYIPHFPRPKPAPLQRAAGTAPVGSALWEAAAASCAWY